MTETGADIALLLAASRAGDESARQALYAAVHRELSAIAAFLLRREGRAVSLQTADLVNEAALRLLQSGALPAREKAHFLSIAARAMRNVLVDAARRRDADKRRRVAVTLNTDAGAEDRPFELLALEAALARLKAVDPERAEIVVMRYYGGMTTEEIAAHLGVSESTVKRAWRAACAWLKGAMDDERS